jgi:hypothetical protein
MASTRIITLAIELSTSITIVVSHNVRIIACCDYTYGNVFLLFGYLGHIDACTASIYVVVGRPFYIYVLGLHLGSLINDVDVEDTI